MQYAWDRACYKYKERVWYRMVSEQSYNFNMSEEIDMVYNVDFNDAISHGILVSNLAGMLSCEMGLSQAECYELAQAGMVHDIGKLKIGKYLYGRRSDTLKIEEMKYVRLHPELGRDILLNQSNYSDKIIESIYHHHENFDGSGYPDNLSGNAIPYGARILRTCDVFAALVTERPYRAAFEMETAIELMIDEVKNFDMKIFLGFLHMVHDDKFAGIKQYIQDVNHRVMTKSAV